MAVTINPLIRAFWQQQAPPSKTGNYRDLAIERDPDWRGIVCEIPLEHVPAKDIAGEGADVERGTLYCPWCPEFPNGCKSAATQERREAFALYLEDLRRRNLLARKEHERYRIHRANEETGERRRRERKEIEEE